ncbi:hypothetical protein Ddye_017943 [Dipteronia dyeriana]|uniref:Reverse transcriptase zinc-binding domain-containing protein n=1 Tax=Dipteronia dyeriana TaxID=168575 RepID=A0AAD9UA69_9ROSI|nr:hypothetical protein Ddye_017943 [Dipteronia dyeriana]
MANLGKMDMLVAGKCPLCNKVDEIMIHSLWECQKWKYARLEWLSKNALRQRNHTNFVDLIIDCAFNSNADVLKLFCVITWRLWFLRNSFVHNVVN